MYSRKASFARESRLDLRAPDLLQDFKTLSAGEDGDDGKHGVHGPVGNWDGIINIHSKTINDNINKNNNNCDNKSNNNESVKNVDMIMMMTMMLICNDENTL